jgi:hypothetical protein
VSRQVTKYTLFVLSRSWHDLATKKKKQGLKKYSLLISSKNKFTLTNQIIQQTS